MTEATFVANKRDQFSPSAGARVVARRTSQRAFLGVSAVLFAASAVITIICCSSMSAMGEMPMPGGWTMSMAWGRMPGQR
jgi:hypothetical protein